MPKIQKLNTPQNGLDASLRRWAEQGQLPTPEPERDSSQVKGAHSAPVVDFEYEDYTGPDLSYQADITEVPGIYTSCQDSRRTPVHNTGDQLRETFFQGLQEMAEDLNRKLSGKRVSITLHNGQVRTGILSEVKYVDDEVGVMFLGPKDESSNQSYPHARYRPAMQDQTADNLIDHSIKISKPVNDDKFWTSSN